MKERPAPPVARRAGALVRERRRASGITLRELSERTGLKYRHLIKIESGNGATLDNLAVLASALGVPLKELVP